MIIRVSGDLLRADVEALVNAVNCVGMMGKGIALQFKEAFPANFAVYRDACAAKLVMPGKLLTIAVNGQINPHYIVNFPTKRHWRDKAHIEDIKSGLLALVAEVHRFDIQSIAIPALGSGLGGLAWSQIAPLIIEMCERIPAVRVLPFEP